MEHAHTYVRCGQCHRRWPNQGLVAAHQKRPRVWRAGAWQHSDASCQRASIERVRVAAGSGALATRTTVSVLRPAEPEPRESSDSEGDGRLGSDEDLGLDIEECLEDERAARQLHTDGQTLHVFRGGPAAQGPACLGDAVAPAEEAEVCARPKQTPRLSATEAGYVAYTANFALTDKAADGLLAWVQSPEFAAQDLRYSSAASYKALMDPLATAGIHSVLLHQPALDGDNIAQFWYRTAEEIVLGMLQDPAMAPFINYEYKPEFDPVTGERVYSSVNNSCMLQALYARHGQSDVVIVPVMVASDATCVQKRRAEHPVYVSCGLMSCEARERDEAWRLAGNVPQYDKEAMRPREDGAPHTPEDIFRRKRRLLQDALAHVMSGMQEHEPSVRTIKCGDGVTRRVLLALGAFVTDREEHTVSHGHARAWCVVHACAECACASVQTIAYWTCIGVFVCAQWTCNVV